MLNPSASQKDKGRKGFPPLNVISSEPQSGEREIPMM